MKKGGINSGFKHSIQQEQSQNLPEDALKCSHVSIWETSRTPPNGKAPAPVWMQEFCFINTVCSALALKICFQRLLQLIFIVTSNKRERMIGNLRIRKIMPIVTCIKCLLSF